MSHIKTTLKKAVDDLGNLVSDLEGMKEVLEGLYDNGKDTQPMAINLMSRVSGYIRGDLITVMDTLHKAGRALP